MTNTVEIIKVLLEDEVTLEVLRAINTEDYMLDFLIKSMPSYTKEKIVQAATYLDKVALIDHIFTKSRDFYRISARGTQIFKMVGTEVPHWRCPIHNERLIELPLPDNYEGDTWVLKVLFCASCKKKYSVDDLFAMVGSYEPDEFDEEWI